MNEQSSTEEDINIAGGEMPRSRCVARVVAVAAVEPNSMYSTQSVEFLPLESMAGQPPDEDDEDASDQGAGSRDDTLDDICMEICEERDHLATYSETQGVIDNKPCRELLFEACMRLPNVNVQVLKTSGFPNGFHDVMQRPDDRTDTHEWMMLLVGLVIFPHFNLQIKTSALFQKTVGQEFYNFCTAPESKDYALKQFGPTSQPTSRLMEFLVLFADYEQLDPPSTSSAVLTLYPMVHVKTLMDFAQEYFQRHPRKLSYSTPYAFWSVVYNAIMTTQKSGKAKPAPLTGKDADQAPSADPHQEAGLTEIRKHLHTVKVPQVTTKTQRLLGHMSEFIVLLYPGTYLGPNYSGSEFFQQKLRTTHQPPRVARKSTDGAAALIQRKTKTPLQKSIEEMYQLHVVQTAKAQVGKDAIQYWLDLLPRGGGQLLGLPVTRSNLGSSKDYLTQILQKLSDMEDSRCRDDVDLAMQYVLARLKEIGTLEDDPLKSVHFRDLDDVTRNYLAKKCFQQISKSKLDSREVLLCWLSGQKFTPRHTVGHPLFFTNAMQKHFAKFIERFIPVMIDEPMAVTNENHDVQDIFVDILKRFREEESKPKESRFQELSEEEAAAILSQSGVRAPTRADGGAASDGLVALAGAGDLVALAGAAEKVRDQSKSLICKLIITFFEHYLQDGGLQCIARALELFLSLCVNIDIRTIFVLHVFPDLFCLSLKIMPLLDEAEHETKLKELVRYVLLDVPDKGYITQETRNLVTEHLKSLNKRKRQGGPCAPKGKGAKRS